jgi:hypothetical protein
MGINYHVNPQRDTELPTLATLTAATTSTVIGTDLDTSMHRGIAVFVNITAISGTGATLTVTIKGKSPAGVDYTILASAGLTATGQTVLTVYPAIPASANVTAQSTIPVVTHVDYAITGTSPSITGTITAVLLY